MSRRLPDPSVSTRYVALVALCLIASALASIMGITSRSRASRELADTWPATIEVNGTMQQTELPLPMAYALHHIPTDALVTWRIPVTLSDDEPNLGVYVQNALHSAELAWDGTTIGHIGDVRGPRAETAGSRGLVAEVPPVLARAGTHQLTLAVRGAYGQGGVVGEVSIGRTDALELHAQSRSFHTSILASVTALTGVVSLILAALRGGRREFLWMGIFFSAIACYAFAHSDDWFLLTDDQDSRMRVWHLGFLLACGTGAEFMGEFAERNRRPLVHAFGAACGIAAVVSLGVPVMDMTPPMYAFGGAVGGLALLASLAMLVAGVHHQVDGAMAMALSVMVLTLVSALELARAWGVAPELHVFIPGMVFFTGSASAAVILRHTDAATRYELLFSQARDAILVVGPNGRIDRANEAADALIGRQARGTLLLDAVEWSERGVMAEHLRGMGAGRRAEVHIVQPDGGDFQVESVAVDLPEGTAMLVLRDITARRKVEEGMLAAARMETVGILARGIAHDFNNALGALMAHIGMLQAKVQGAKEQERLGRMEAVVRRTAQMSRRLLTLARGGTGTQVPLEVAATVHDAAELTRSMLPANIEIKERFDAYLPSVLASPAELEQALLNLLVNARDAMTDVGGTITVEASKHIVDGITQGVRITVTDEGPGIPSHVRQRIFDPFFTTKGMRGTGLGLSVVARIVREHSGTIEAREGPGGKGARFELVLPMVEAPEVTEAERPPSQAIRVLVVDDDPDIREMMFRELQARDYTVAHADTAISAQATFINAEGAFDVLVTDVVLPGMSGIELAKFLQTEKPKLRVLVVSGFIPEHESAIPSHWHTIPKPFTAEQLATAVRRVLVQTEPPSPRPGDVRR